MKAEAIIQHQNGVPDGRFETKVKQGETVVSINDSRDQIYVGIVDQSLWNPLVISLVSYMGTNVNSMQTQV